MKQITRKKDIPLNLESRDCTIYEVKHIWHQPSDRWIYIEKHENGRLILNFMQGDEYKLFKEEYCCEDQALSNFYYEMIQDKIFDFEIKEFEDIELIDKIIWIFYKAKASILNS